MSRLKKLLSAVDANDRLCIPREEHLAAISALILGAGTALIQQRKRAELADLLAQQFPRYRQTIDIDGKAGKEVGYVSFVLFAVS